MITTLTDSFKPIELFTGIDRLDLSQSGARRSEPVPADLLPTDWDQVNHEVRQVLSVLAGRVCRRWPMVRSRPGRTSGKSFFLFAYRVFDLGESEDIDPVIVGLNFDPVPGVGRVRVQGDIGGESTGRIDFETDPVEVPNDRPAILAAALQAAWELAERAELVAGEVLARHAPPDY